MNQLPGFFKPLFWSYNFSSLDTEKHKKTIIITALNYGDLKHWQWIKRYYGPVQIRKVLRAVLPTELRDRAGKLAAVIFDSKL